jgi:hypothetical protein
MPRHDALAKATHKVKKKNIYLKIILNSRHAYPEHMLYQ